MQSFGEAVYTFFMFIGFLFLIPPSIFVYIYVLICRTIWNALLACRYPYLELVTRLSVRSAMDTYRTQGILTIVLEVKGQCDVQVIRQKVMQDVIYRTRKDGTLRFPHMKCCLTSCWGRYAWIRDTSQFNISNHVVHITNPVLRNRPVTNANIQEYISEQTTKFIPPWNNLPPWQLMMISTAPDRFYLLARVHHLYVSEDDINFGHLLMIKKEEEWIATPPQEIDSIEDILQQIFRQPRSFPMLYNHLGRALSNACSRLIATYDPLHNPHFESSSPNIFEFYIVCLIAALAIVREYLREGEDERDLVAIVRRETSSRHLGPVLFLRCCLNTLYPFVIVRLVVAWWWFICVKCLLHLPITALHFVYHTQIYTRWFFISLRALDELVYLLYLVYTAPRAILDELLWPLFRRPGHHLQRSSLSGRKVVCWTEPIPIDLIRGIRNKTGVASCEIQLFAVAASLADFFAESELKVGKQIETTARFIPQEHLLKSAGSISSGLLCLNLPMNMPADDALYGLHMMQQALQEAMTSQTPLYLASLWQYDYGLLTTIFPSYIARILLYVLSTRYSIMVTHVEAHTKEMKKRHLIWGQQVESFIYWRPPQANVCLSVTVINYGEEMRFAVMADAQLAPNYTNVVSRYVYHIKQLAEEAENYTVPPQVPGMPSSLPTIDEETKIA